MKLLVIGIDAVSPDILFGRIEEFPNIKSLLHESVYGSYIGYTYGYGSRDNWISMYTGLIPEEHGTRNNTFHETGNFPRLYDYTDKIPFWKVLNEKGYKVGMWKGISTSPPEEIDGYIAAGEYALEEDAKDPEIWSDIPKFHPNLSRLSEMLISKPPKSVMPKGPESIGLSWKKIEDSPDLLLQLMTDDYFKESLVYLREMLDYHLLNIERLNEVEQVDLFWFYDLIFDFLGHFQMHDSNKKIVIEALKIIDTFVGKLILILKPENILFLSDHGQLSFSDQFPDMDISTRKEAFGLTDQSIFIDNHIFIPARNGGVMSAGHAPEATLIASGPLFKNNIKLKNEYRTLDIYPLILEIFDCTVPNNRTGFVPAILKKDKYINTVYPKDRLFSDVLLIANMPVYEMNAFINQYFLKNRFHNIYVMAEEKLIPTYRINQHIKECFAMRDMATIQKEYSKIIIPTENTKYSLNYVEYVK